MKTINGIRNDEVWVIATDIASYYDRYMVTGHDRVYELIMEREVVCHGNSLTQREIEMVEREAYAICERIAKGERV